MTSNFTLLNSDKGEVIVLGPKKHSLLIKDIVRAGSGDPEPSFSYAAIGHFFSLHMFIYLYCI